MKLYQTRCTLYAHKLKHTEIDSQFNRHDSIEINTHKKNFYIYGKIHITKLKISNDKLFYLKSSTVKFIEM